MPAMDRKFLIFFMHGQRYAFDLSDVAEVMDITKSWPIPFAPDCYSGAINFHGAIVAVMNLAVFMGSEACGELEKIIVLNEKSAALGFLVERVARIVSAQEIEISDPSDDRFASALLRLPEGSATLLDIETIIRESEILINN